MLAQTSTSVVSTPAKATPIRNTSFKTRTSTPIPAQQIPPSPGNFRHPRLTEIIARRSATSFTNRNVQIAVVNIGVLIISFIISNTLHSLIAYLLHLSSIDSPRSVTTSINLFRVFLLSNVFHAFRPVIPYIKKTDEVTDIPLTPSQRVLLGLPPSSNTTSTEDIKSGMNTQDQPQYITPPRYRRSSSSSFSNNKQDTPFQSVDRRSISANYSTSPLSTSRYTLGFSPSPTGQPTSHHRTSNTPFSPNSPFRHKALVDPSSSRHDRDLSPSAGTTAFSKGLSRSQSFQERRSNHLEEPGTPSPSTASKRTPGLNYKWLYEKGYRTSTGGEAMGF